MKDQIVNINLGPVWRRALLLLPAGLALFAVWMVGRWCLGATLAEYPLGPESARAAERLAPEDPSVHFTLGVFARRSFEPEEVAEALRRYERATALSPNDYRLWVELGRLRGQAGDEGGGELALRRATELAPHYALPRWYLGNLLLRAGREADGFAELRRAAEADPKLHTQIFTMAWSFFGGDVKSVVAAVGDSTEARSRLVTFLAAQKRYDDALALWRSLSAAERKGEAETGRGLVDELVKAGRFHKALEVYREVAPDGAQWVTVGAVTNGGFEADVSASGGNPFDWNIKTVPQAQVGLDTRNPRGGARSLRVAFNAPNNFTFGNFSQLVLIETPGRYRLTYFVRTEELKGVSTLVTEVLDAAGRGIAASAPLPAGSSEWRQVTLEFTTPPQGEGVTVRVVRPPCPDEVCPVFGKVWYDDFNLQRAGGDGGARAARGV